jgi:hypothetical protein
MSVLVQRLGLSSTGNRATWTFSAWVKRSRSLSSANEFIFSSNTERTGGGQYSSIYFQNDCLSYYDYYSSAKQKYLHTNRKFRDVNAWYHIVVRVDTTQSTASDRIRFYVNGVQETSFSSSDYPAVNDNSSFVNWSGADNFVGTQTNNLSAHFLGSMSHVYLCDGQSYAPTVFGSTDSTTGEWKINTSPTITMGTNGFTILKDGNTVTDQSSNSNDFSIGSGTLTKTEDNPSNVFCTLNRNIVQAGGVSGRHANVSASLDNGNTTAGEGTGVFSNQLGTIFASSGKYYAECKFGGDQYCHFGVTSPNFSDASLGSYPGDGIGGVNSAGIYGNGGIARCNGATIFTDSNITTDTICLAMDLDNGALYIRRNDGSWMNSGNPESGATKTGAITLPSDTYSWIVTSHNNSGSGRNYMKVNFGNGYFGTTAVSSAGTNASGNGIFEYDVPTGYTALSTKGLNL